MIRSEEFARPDPALSRTVRKSGLRVTGLRTIAAYATLLVTFPTEGWEELMGGMRLNVALKSRLSCTLMGSLHHLTVNAYTFAHNRVETIDLRIS